MKKMILPQNKKGFLPTGIYVLPKGERKSAFENLLEDSTKRELTEYRLKALQGMRGEM